MRCPRCKAEIADDSLFCNKCGERLDQHDPAVAGLMPESPMEQFKEAAASRMDVKDEPEAELWRGGYSPKAMIGNWVACGLGGLVILVIAFLWLMRHPLWFWLFVLAAFLPALYNLAVLFYRKLSVHYLLTNQRFIHESGFFRRVTNRIEVLDMDDISFEQGLIERMMGVGTIRIHSSDISHPELYLRGIENVGEISNLIDNTRRSERKKRGLHIENI
jgi:uncharacterized membrane protein YdbT with pleckstrin-like domain